MEEENRGNVFPAQIDIKFLFLNYWGIHKQIIIKRQITNCSHVQPSQARHLYRGVTARGALYLTPPTLSSSSATKKFVIIHPLAWDVGWGEVGLGGRRRR